jgi:hypothetical protein
MAACTVALMGMNPRHTARSYRSVWIRTITLTSSERLRQMLDDGCRLNTDASVIDQDRNLPPAGQRLKLWRLVGTLLKADVPERERLA